MDTHDPRGLVSRFTTSIGGTPWRVRALLGALIVSACGGEGAASGDDQDRMGLGGATGGEGSTGGSSSGGSPSGGSPSGGNSSGGNSSGGSSTEACDSGEYGDESTGCLSWSECAAGEYVEEAGTATSDRQCAGCSSGSFSTSVNASQCTTWTTCAAGKYVSNTPSATVDRVCTDCPAGTYTTGPNQSVCQDGACPAGTVQTAAGSSTTAAECDPCASGNHCAGGTAAAAPCAVGTWDHDDSPATACAPQTECIAGKYVSNTPSAVVDRVCTGCASGTYTADPNETVCQDGTCPAGTVQTAAGSSTSAAVCDACDAGSYCAGGESAAVPCAFGTWDDDGEPATACEAKTDCVAGEYVDDEGDATTQRQCADCVNGFSIGTNAVSCTDWTVCPDGYVEDEPGTETSDRTCRPEWPRQFGSSGSDVGYSVTVDGSGNVYVAGRTTGTLPGQTSAGGYDVFVRKHDSAGVEQWTRQFGSSNTDFGHSVSVDGNGNVYVAGYTQGTLPGQASAGYYDVFVRKYDASGTEQWTRQFGSSAYEDCYSVSVDGSGNVYVAGRTDGTLPGQTSVGSWDAFLRKYNTAGVEQWTRQFGTGSLDNALAVSVSGSGTVYVAGATYGTMPGQANAGMSDAFLSKYDSSGTAQWTRQFGSSGYDNAQAVSVDGSGNVYVGGSTNDTLPAQTSAGGYDAFVTKYDSAGTAQWTRQFGTSSQDQGQSVSVSGSGKVYVVGTTQGTLSGQTNAGLEDAFVKTYDSAGTEQGTWQFGTSSSDSAYSVSVDVNGNVYVAGATGGTLPGQTSAGSDDAFVVRLIE